MTAAPPLPIATSRLVLRPYRSTDVDPLLGYYTRPDVARYLLDEPWTRAVAEEQVAARLQKRHITAAQEAVALVVQHELRVIGDVSLWAADATLSRGEVGWVFHPDADVYGLLAGEVGR